MWSVRESKLGQRLRTNGLVTTEAEQMKESREGSNSLARKKQLSHQVSIKINHYRSITEKETFT